LVLSSEQRPEEGRKGSDLSHPRLARARSPELSSGGIDANIFMPDELGASHFLSGCFILPPEIG
jgi:hypothetical protein